MRKLPFVIVLALLAGCAYNSTSTTITSQGSVTWTGTNSVEKPVDVRAGAQNNMPAGGSSVTSPSLTNAK